MVQYRPDAVSIYTAEGIETKHMKLTANQIRYILTIRRLDETKHVIKSVDIANEFDYSRASVHKMMKNLKDLNYVSQEYYGSVKLTPAGKRAANDCLNKYNQLKEVLDPVIDVEDDYDLAICNLIELL